MLWAEDNLAVTLWVKDVQGKEKILGCHTVILLVTNFTREKEEVCAGGKRELSKRGLQSCDTGRWKQYLSCQSWSCRLQGLKIRRNKVGVKPSWALRLSKASRKPGPGVLTSVHFSWLATCRLKGPKDLLSNLTPAFCYADCFLYPWGGLVFGWWSL